jgi:catechol 2,3-dioxygenase-like lactoylglutathione lyase family enzyme
MNLNHAHLAGPDMRALQRFYETWFGFRVAADHGDGVFLRNDAGFLLALDPVAEAPRFPAWFHLGFCLDAPGPVRDLHARMQSAGVPLPRDLVDIEGAATAFHCVDPAGTRIEVSWHASDD